MQRQRPAHNLAGATNAPRTSQQTSRRRRGRQPLSAKRKTSRLQRVSGRQGPRGGLAGNGTPDQPDQSPHRQRSRNQYHGVSRQLPVSHSGRLSLLSSPRNRRSTSSSAEQARAPTAPSGAPVTRTQVRYTQHYQLRWCGARMASSPLRSRPDHASAAWPVPNRPTRGREKAQGCAPDRRGTTSACALS
jgi:hypothetical protein